MNNRYCAPTVPCYQLFILGLAMVVFVITCWIWLSGGVKSPPEIYRETSYRSTKIEGDSKVSMTYGDVFAEAAVVLVDVSSDYAKVTICSENGRLRALETFEGDIRPVEGYSRVSYLAEIRVQSPYPRMRLKVIEVRRLIVHFQDGRPYWGSLISEQHAQFDPKEVRSHFEDEEKMLIWLRQFDEKGVRTSVMRFNF